MGCSASHDVHLNPVESDLNTSAECLDRRFMRRRGRYAFDNPFESSQWLERNRYRLFWRAADFAMSRHELRALRSDWKKLTQSSPQPKVALKTFKCMRDRCPEVMQAFRWRNIASTEELFRDKRFLKHAHLFQDTIDIIIDDLERGATDVHTTVVTFGTQHSYMTRHHMKPSYWGVYGDALLEAMKHYHNRGTVGIKFLRCWRKFVQFLIASMQIGYAIGFSQDELPARFAFRRAIVDNELMFFPLAKNIARGINRAKNTADDSEGNQDTTRFPEFQTAFSDTITLCLPRWNNHRSSSVSCILNNALGGGLLSRRSTQNVIPETELPLPPGYAEH